MRTLVVLPTYNEAATIAEVLRRIRAAAPAADVLVVDDSSPDGTADLAKAAGVELGGIEVLLRPGKSGLGSAYREGFAGAWPRATRRWWRWTPTCPTTRPSWPPAGGDRGGRRHRHRHPLHARRDDPRLVRGAAGRSPAAGNLYAGMALGLARGRRHLRLPGLPAAGSPDQPHRRAGRRLRLPDRDGLQGRPRRRRWPRCRSSSSTARWATSKMSSRIIVEALVLVTWWGVRSRLRARRRGPRRRPSRRESRPPRPRPPRPPRPSTLRRCRRWQAGSCRVDATTGCRSSTSTSTPSTPPSRFWRTRRWPGSPSSSAAPAPGGWWRPLLRGPGSACARPCRRSGPGGSAPRPSSCRPGSSSTASSGPAARDLPRLHPADRAHRPRRGLPRRHRRPPPVRLRRRDRRRHPGRIAGRDRPDRLGRGRPQQAAGQAGVRGGQAHGVTRRGRARAGRARGRARARSWPSCTPTPCGPCGASARPPTPGWSGSASRRSATWPPCRRPASSTPSARPTAASSTSWPAPATTGRWSPTGVKSIGHEETFAGDVADRAASTSRCCAWPTRSATASARRGGRPHRHPQGPLPRLPHDHPVPHRARADGVRARAGPAGGRAAGRGRLLARGAAAGCERVQPGRAPGRAASFDEAAEGAAARGRRRPGPAPVAQAVDDVRRRFGDAAVGPASLIRGGA